MNPKVYLITGPIGSGKSTACNYIKQHGKTTVDLDIVSNSILESPESIDFLEKNFKSCIIDGKVDRKLLAEIVFKEPSQLQILESYLHPLVLEKLTKIIGKAESDVFIEVSAPKNLHKDFSSIVIIADEKVRRERLKLRGMSPDDIDNRINTQQNEDWWRSLGKVVENDTLVGLENNLKKIINFKVISDFSPQGDQPTAIQNLKQGVINNLDYQTLMGITGSGKSATIAWLIEELQMPSLVLAPNKALAAQLANEFKQFFPENRVEYFVSYYDYYQPEAYVPRTDTFIEKDSNINEEIDRLRHSATSALLLRKDVIVVYSVSCIYGLGSPQEYKNKIIPLIKGSEFELDKLLEELIKQQYVRNDLVVTRGTFRLKGDTLDIFPVYEETIFRIEYFGDEIENITRIDPITGEILEKLTELAILPASHYVTSEDVMNNALSQIEKDMNKQIKKFEKEEKLLEAQRIKQRTMFDLEMLRELGVCSGIENYSRYFDGRNRGDHPYTLLDFFQEEFLMVVDESHIAIPQIRGQFAGDKSRKTTLVDYGFRLPAALDNRPLKFEEWQTKVKNTVLVSATPGKWENSNSQNFVEQIIRPTGLIDPKIVIRPTENQIEDLLKEIKQVISKGNRVLVTTLTKKMSEALSDYFLKMGIKTRYLHSDIDTLERIEILRDLRKGEFDVLVGINLLREGLDLPEVQLVAILDADKEGFLRSETSLIQTVGRAARNQEGYVIMYADKITDSMTFAINETERRRGIQQEHNRVNNITPKTIQKEITDILELVEKTRGSSNISISKSKLNLNEASKTDLIKLSKNIEKEMNLAADLLEFELAARLRDELKELKKEINNYSE